MIKQKLFPSQIRFSIRNLIWFLLEECPFPHWLVWCCRTGSGRGCGRGDTTLISRTNLISLKMFPSGQSGLRRISKKVARLPSIEQQLLFLWDLHYFLSPLFLSQLNGNQTLRRRFDPRKTGKTRGFLTNQKQVPQNKKLRKQLQTREKRAAFFAAGNLLKR